HPACAEIEVLEVQRWPVERREVIGRQTGERGPLIQAKDSFAVHPFLRLRTIARAHEKGDAVGGYPARSPDSSPGPLRSPPLHVGGIEGGNAHHPASKVRAVAGMPSIGYVDSAVEESQGASLVFYNLVKPGHKRADVRWPTGHRAPVLQR